MKQGKRKQLIVRLDNNLKDFIDTYSFDRRMSTNKIINVVFEEWREAEDIISNFDVASSNSDSTAIQTLIDFFNSRMEP